MNVKRDTKLKTHDSFNSNNIKGDVKDIKVNPNNNSSLNQPVHCNEDAQEMINNICNVKESSSFN